jgi:hypothetical protein
MNDAFLDDLARQWRSENVMDLAGSAAEIARRRRHLNRDAVLAAVGAVLVIALAIAFGIWAVGARSLLIAAGAAAFAAAVPLLVRARARKLGLLHLRYEASPRAHLEMLQALLEHDRSSLAEARACAYILAASSIVALGLVTLGMEPAVAFIPAAAWAITASVVEGWRFRFVQRLQHTEAALERVAATTMDLTEPTVVEK